MEWCDPSQSTGYFSVDNEASLALVDATRHEPGTSVAYVGTYRAYFALTVSTAIASPATRVNALGLLGYQWIRCAESRSWWTQTNWLWDPSNSTGIASDENDGLIMPVLHCDEIERRLRWRVATDDATQTIVITQLSDGGDVDVLYLNLSYKIKPPNVFLNGTVTVVPVGNITAAQAKDPTQNHGNVITVPGFDFSPHLGRNVRLVGTSGNTTVCAVIEEVISLGVARLAEQVIGAIGVGTGFTIGQNIEILKLTKLVGVNVHGSGVLLTECLLTKTTGQILMTVNEVSGGLTMNRCQVQGNLNSQNNICVSQLTMSSCSIIGGNWNFNVGCTFNPTGGAAINCPRLMLQTCDGRHHLFYFGLTNSMIFAFDFTSVRLSGDFHCFNLGLNAVGLAMHYGSQAYLSANYYGGGNDATSAGICMVGNVRFSCGGASVLYMNAGKGIVFDSNDDPTVANNGGFSVPFSSVPYPSPPGTLTPRLSAAYVG